MERKNKKCDENNIMAKNIYKNLMTYFHCYEAIVNIEEQLNLLYSNF